MRSKTKWFFTLFSVLSFCFSFAQERNITGVVSDEIGPLPGVNVLIKGTQKSVQTNFDGKFEISAKQGDVFVVSFLGKKTKEVTVGASSVVNVSLQDDVIQIDEMVVTAYQNKKREDIVGSISTISKKDLDDQRVTTVTEALQGVAGVSLVNTSGQPGSTPTIRIRGPQSLSGIQDPLIILDGAQYKGNINAINFDDVSSYSILKDADAVALYGNRGSKGVIVITTKRGSNRQGKDQINIGMSYGISDKATDEYDYVDATQMMKLVWQAQKNSFMNAGIDAVTAGQASSANLVNLTQYNPFNHAMPIDENGNVAPGASLLYDTNWYDVITQKAYRQDVNMSVSGGNEKTQYFASGSFLDSDGFMRNSKFKRVGGRLNVDSQVRDWLKIGASSNFTNSFSNVPVQSGSTFSNNLGFSRSVSNIFPIYQTNPDGSINADPVTGERYYDFGDGWVTNGLNGILGAGGGPTRGFYAPYNPIPITDNNLNKYDRISVDVSPYLEVTFAKDLKLRTQYSYSYYLIASNEYYDPRFGDARGVGGRSNKARNSTETYTLTNTLNYSKVLNEKHTITALLGQETFNNEQNDVSVGRTGFPTHGLTELVNGALISAGTSASFQNRLFSYFGRLDYDYDKKYYIGGSYRRDGSSRFTGDNQWGNFWSIGGAWNIAEENFLKDSNFVSSLKFRASYGEVGNEDLGVTSEFLFPYLGSYEVGWNIRDESGAIPARTANPNLTWERHKKTNFGLDFGFFNNRLSGTVEYFNNDIQDMIYAQPLPASENGGLQTYVNGATMTNKGWELELNSVNVQNENFRWTTSLSATSIKNEISSLPRELIVGNIFRWEEGRDRYEFYMPEWAGVDSQTGNPQWYRDVTVGGVATGERELTTDYATATRYYTGKSALPDLEGRIHNKFEYKNFDLGFAFYYRFGGYIYNTDYSGLMHGFHGSNPGTQLDRDIEAAWQQPGDITDVPRLSLDNDNSNSTSTRWLQKGDFIRLRNVSFGYSFDKDVLKSLELSSLRLYVTADNYFTWKKDDRIDDPEQSYGGTTSNSSTVMKTITFGLNVSF